MQPEQPDSPLGSYGLWIEVSSINFKYSVLQFSKGLFLTQLLYLLLDENSSVKQSAPHAHTCPPPPKKKKKAEDLSQNLSGVGKRLCVFPCCHYTIYDHWGMFFLTGLESRCSGVHNSSSQSSQNNWINHLHKQEIFPNLYDVLHSIMHLYF